MDTLYSGHLHLTDSTNHILKYRPGNQGNHHALRSTVLLSYHIIVFLTLNKLLSSRGKTTPTKFPVDPGLRDVSELSRVILRETPRPVGGVDRLTGES